MDVNVIALVQPDGHIAGLSDRHFSRDTLRNALYQ
jgi:hypothetical protein